MLKISEFRIHSSNISLILTVFCLFFFRRVGCFHWQLGTHKRAKRKREELSNILVSMRKAASRKEKPAEAKAE